MAVFGNVYRWEGVSSFIHLFLIGLTAEKLSKIINKIKINIYFCLISPCAARTILQA